MAMSTDEFSRCRKTTAQTHRGFRPCAPIAGRVPGQEYDDPVEDQEREQGADAAS